MKLKDGVGKVYIKQERLKELRGKTSKAAFGRKLGVTGPYIYQLEESVDPKNPSKQVVLKLAYLLEEKFFYLIGAVDSLSIDPIEIDEDKNIHINYSPEVFDAFATTVKVDSELLYDQITHAIEQPYDMELLISRKDKATNALNVIFEYKKFSSPLDENVLRKIVSSEELTDYLEFLYYKFSNE